MQGSSTGASNEKSEDGRDMGQDEISYGHLDSFLSLCFETGMGQGLPDSVQPSIRKPFSIRSAC